MGKLYLYLYVLFTGEIGVGLPAGARRGASTDHPPMLFPADAVTPSIDRHSGRWAPKTLQNGRGRGHDRASEMADQPLDNGMGNRRVPSPPAPIGRSWTISRRRGRMGAQNGGQRPGLRRRGAPVEMGAGNLMRGRERSDR